ncbi:MAG: hypothetical protein F4Y44_02300 [Chloroflexi bacterium]|nr:hypothetical protein [Chloroflexota bacterium]
MRDLSIELAASMLQRVNYLLAQYNIVNRLGGEHIAKRRNGGNGKNGGISKDRRANRDDANGTNSNGKHQTAVPTFAL